jgi:hypothetical protein
MCPQLLRFCSVLGKDVMTFLLLLPSVSSMLFVMYKNRLSGLLFLCVIGSWLVCFFYPMPEAQRPLWIPQVVSVPATYSSRSPYPVSTAKVLARDFAQIVAQNSDVNCIVLPESAANCESLFQSPELVALWSEQNIGKPLHIICGSCRSDGLQQYNSAYWVYNGVVQCCFDKRHAMLITERLGYLLESPFWQNIYFNAGLQTTVSVVDRGVIAIDNQFQCVPYICSELFFYEQPFDCFVGSPIVVLVNDSLFRLSAFSGYMTHLLVLLARYKAIAWQRGILYISYANSVFIDSCGLCYELSIFPLSK